MSVLHYVSITFKVEEIMSDNQSKKGVIREYGEAIIVALLLATFIRFFLVSAFTIPSGSMLNTIQIGDYLLVNKLSYGLKIPFIDKWVYKNDGPEYGDIIVFKYPVNPSIDFIKRVVGLPGDVMQMRDKQLYRNGEPVKEAYIINSRPQHIGTLDNTTEFTLAENEYYTLGDNRDNSEDSRAWGSVHRDAIYGKAWRIYWSWDSKEGKPRFTRLGQLVD